MRSNMGLRSYAAFSCYFMIVRVSQDTEDNNSTHQRISFRDNDLNMSLYQ